MNNKQDARQTISRDTLPKIALAANTQADALLRSLDSEVTQPLFLSPTASPSLTVNVGPSKVANPLTGRTRALSSIGTDAPTITSGTLVFPSASGGTVTITPGINRVITVGSGQWIKGTVTINATNQLDITFGTAAASEALANAPRNPEGTIGIGYISVQNIGGTIQPIGISKIYQYDAAIPKFTSTGSDSLTSVSLPYTIVDDDNGKVLMIDTSAGPGNLTLPTPTLNFRIKVKDKTGNFRANPVTMLRSGGGVKIEGLASNYILEADWGEWTFVADGSDWYII